MSKRIFLKKNCAEIFLFRTARARYACREMIPLDICVFFALIVVIAVLMILVAWIYYDRRERVTRDHERIVTAFCCVRCGKIYSRPRSREISPCPNCGAKNHRLKF